MLPTKLAQSVNLSPGGLAANLQNISVPGIISAGILLILVIGAIIFFIMLLIGGVKWIMSGGDKAQTESARNQITAALVGLVIIFAAWAIVRLVEAFFGVSILNGINIPSAANT